MAKHKKTKIEDISEIVVDRIARDRERTRREMEQVQVVCYTMCGGGGQLGDTAARRPGIFYIDTRCGKLPYPAGKILQAVEWLKVYAELLGEDPKNLPFESGFPHLDCF